MNSRNGMKKNMDNHTNGNTSRIGLILMTIGIVLVMGGTGTVDASGSLITALSVIGLGILSIAIGSKFCSSWMWVDDDDEAY